MSRAPRRGGCRSQLRKFRRWASFFMSFKMMGCLGIPEGSPVIRDCTGKHPNLDMPSYVHHTNTTHTTAQAYMLTWLVNLCSSPRSRARGGRIMFSLLVARETAARRRRLLQSINHKVHVLVAVQQ